MSFTKPAAWLLLFNLITSFLFAQKSAPPLVIKRITGDYYVYTTYGTLDDGSKYPSNSMYVVTDKGVVMIDVPWDTSQATPLLDSIQKRHHKKVIACISTHFHKDRTAGLDFLKSKGINTYASAQTIQFCKEKKEQIPEFAILTEDSTFDFGNHKVEIFYPGKGHTADNIVVWFPDSHILYGGCFVKSTASPNLGNLEDAYPGEWTASVQKVKAKFKSIEYIIPGHDSWKSKASLEHTLKLLREFKAKQ